MRARLGLGVEVVDILVVAAINVQIEEMVELRRVRRE